jgi:hypothetical protein
MANNTVLNTGTGGDTIQTIDNTTYKTQVICLADSTGANKAAVNASGVLSISEVSTDYTGTGNLTAAAQAVTISSLNDIDNVSVQITGTWVGTVTFEGSVDGTNYFVINGGTFASTGVLVSTATANGQWQFDVAGVQSFRARCSAFTSGTIVVTVRGSGACSMVGLDGPVQTLGLGTITTTGDTGAKTATGNGAAQTAPTTAKGVAVVCVMSASSGTSPTCVLNVQVSLDGGTNYVTVCSTGSITASTATPIGLIVYPTIAATSAGTTVSSVSTKIGSFLAPTWRMSWTIGGTTPSFTITSITYQYLY